MPRRRPDTGIVRRDHHARHPSGLCGTFDHVGDQGLAGLGEKRLAGQALASKSGGDYEYCHPYLLVGWRVLSSLKIRSSGRVSLGDSHNVRRWNSMMTRFVSL